MNLEDFQKMSKSEVAGIVRALGSRVCVFPINGTRRWFVLEYAGKIQRDTSEAYMDIASQNHIDLYRLFFEHGIDTLVTPEFGADILLRGDEYVQRIGANGLARLATHPTFMNFYMDMGVRVHFYGEYRRHLSQTPYAYLIDLFDEATRKTLNNKNYRLFIGVFGADATQTVSEFSVAYHQEHGKLPERSQIVSKFYGEDVASADLFIGFDKFSAFDYPLLSSGEEDLYFTVSPSPYMSQIQLRAILFDHLYTRRIVDIDYEAMNPEDLLWMKEFYNQNIGQVFGIGGIKAGVWIPQTKLFHPGKTVDKTNLF